MKIDESGQWISIVTSIAWFLLFIPSLIYNEFAWLMLPAFILIFLHPLVWEGFCILIGKNDWINVDFFYLISAILVVSGGLVFSYQCFYYLKFGYWEEISFISLLSLVDNELTMWSNNPSTWIGLHNILSLLPMSLLLVFLGILTFILRLKLE